MPQWKNSKGFLRGKTVKSESVAIYGASGFGRELAWLCETCGITVACFIDDDEKKHKTVINGIEVVSSNEAAMKYAGISVAAGVGKPTVREQIMAKVSSLGFVCRNIIHPRVEMSDRVKKGMGVIVCAGSILTTDIVIGNHVQINLNCTIGHDAVIGDYTTLSPAVNISGWVHLGKRVFVGAGAVFINGTETNPLIVGDDVVIGAGACVTKSIDSGTWGGVPAEPLGKGGC